jgi:hypothetical protein
MDHQKTMQKEDLKMIIDELMIQMIKNVNKLSEKKNGYLPQLLA